MNLYNQHIISFRNNVQAALFEYEITGQLSDGQWENARPHDHWVPWNRCTIIVNPLMVGRTFDAPRDNYKLHDKDLLDCIGFRMLALARVVESRFYDKCIMRNIVLTEVSNMMSVGELVVKDYHSETQSRAIRYAISKGINDVINDESIYDRKKLRFTLMDMREIFKTRITICQPTLTVQS